MAGLKAGKWTYTADELDQMFAEATRRGAERLKTEPRAGSVGYDPRTRRVVIELLNGSTLLVPVDLLQGLRGAPDEDLCDFTLMPRGFDLHWHKLDAQFTVVGLLQGLFGTKRWMAELSREAEAQNTAAHVNGKTAQRSRPASEVQTGKRRRARARLEP